MSDLMRFDASKTDGCFLADLGGRFFVNGNEPMQRPVFDRV